MCQLIDLLKRLESEYTDGYGASRIPSVIDAEIGETVSLMQALAPDKLSAIQSQMTEELGLVLLAYAERAATRMVRENDILIAQGAMYAIAVATNLTYIKNALPVISLLYRSMAKLGTEPERLLLLPIKIVNNRLDEYLIEFVNRSDEDKSIEAMGYIEGEDDDGFHYIRTW